MDLGLNDEELNALADFLNAEAFQEKAMDLSTLQGYLTAVVVGPQAVMPSRWLPRVWDREHGRLEPEFDSLDQANHIINLLMRFMNGIATAFMNDPASFEPVYWREARWGAAEWCEGFLRGTQFNEEAWALLWVGKPQCATPFLRLGTDDGMDITRQSGDAERWMNAVVPALVEIHAFWKARRVDVSQGLSGQDSGASQARRPTMRAAPKVGRNDSCPCGSGKKFKKCCGADTGPTYH